MSNATGDSILKQFFCYIRQLIENNTRIENLPYKDYCLSDKSPRLKSSVKLTPKSLSHRSTTSNKSPKLESSVKLTPNSLSHRSTTSDKIPSLKSSVKLTPNSPSHKNPKFSFKNTQLISRKKQPKVYHSSRKNFKNVKNYKQKSYRVKSKTFHKKRHVISEVNEAVEDDKKIGEPKPSNPLSMRMGHTSIKYREPQKFINSSSSNDKTWIKMDNQK